MNISSLCKFRAWATVNHRSRNIYLLQEGLAGFPRRISNTALLISPLTVNEQASQTTRDSGNKRTNWKLSYVAVLLENRGKELPEGEGGNYKLHTRQPGTGQKLPAGCIIRGNCPETTEGEEGGRWPLGPANRCCGLCPPYWGQGSGILQEEMAC